MGTFAETANLDYRLSFVDQGKVCHFRCLQQLNGSCLFLIVPFSEYIFIYMYVYFIHIFISIYIMCMYINIHAAVSNRKTENRSQGIFFLNVHCLFIVQMEVCLLPVWRRRNKRKLSICKRIKQTKQSAHLFQVCLSITWTTFLNLGFPLPIQKSTLLVFYYYFNFPFSYHSPLSFSFSLFLKFALRSFLPPWALTSSYFLRGCGQSWALGAMKRCDEASNASSLQYLCQC